VTVTVVVNTESIAAIVPVQLKTEVKLEDEDMAGTSRSLTVFSGRLVHRPNPLQPLQPEVQRTRIQR
jgi:hypothetical protein